MGERPDEVRRNPLNGGARDSDPLADPAGGPEEVRSAVGPDPALGGGVGGGAVVDEEEANRAEIERTRDGGRHPREALPREPQGAGQGQGQGSHGEQSPGSRIRYREGKTPYRRR